MLKEAIHRLCRAFGFDVISVRKLEREIRRREEQRDRRRAGVYASIRAERARPAEGTMDAQPMEWVSRERLVAAGGVAMRDVDTVLDIGCAFRPQRYVDARIHICCEPFSDYLRRLVQETKDSGKFVYLNVGIEEACNVFPADAVDSVFLIDVIEHVGRAVALRRLKELQEIARVQVIVFTPIGFMPQHPPAGGTRDQWGMDGVEWQKHQSGWTPDDFQASDGWRVIACRDFHVLDGYGRPLDEPFGAMWAIWTAGIGERTPANHGGSPASLRD